MKKRADGGRRGKTGEEGGRRGKKGEEGERRGRRRGRVAMHTHTQHTRHLVDSSPERPWSRRAPHRTSAKLGKGEGGEEVERRRAKRQGSGWEREEERKKERKRERG